MVKKTTQTNERRPIQKKWTKTRSKKINAYRVRAIDATELGDQTRPVQRGQEDGEHALERRTLRVHVRRQGDHVGREEDTVDGVGVAVVRQHLVAHHSSRVSLPVDQTPVDNFQINLRRVNRGES